MIDEAEAEVIRRIFRDYAAGKSSRAIAWALNKDGIAGPFGHAWGPSTIHGNPQRGNGILNNELYVGRLVWNRQRFVKDPDTDKRVSRQNPPAEWVIQDVPELRLIDQALWDAVKERQRALAFAPRDKASPNPLLDRRRPKHLLAGLAKCGVCGGGYTLISEHLLGCATARNKGTCDNRLNIRRDALETSVLSGLRAHLMDPARSQSPNGWTFASPSRAGRARLPEILELRWPWVNMERKRWSCRTARPERSLFS